MIILNRKVLRKFLKAPLMVYKEAHSHSILSIQMLECPPSPRPLACPPPTPAPWYQPQTLTRPLSPTQVGGSLQEDKEFFGCVPSPLAPRTPTPVGQPCFPPGSAGSVVRERLEKLLVTNTGNSWSPSPRRCLLQDFRKCLDEEDTTSSVGVKPRRNMSGRKRRASKEPNLNLERDPSVGIQELTGSRSGRMLNPEDLTLFPQMYEWSLTGIK